MDSSASLPKRLIGFGLATACVIVTCLIPGSDALSSEGIKALGLLFSLAVLWATSALPTGATALVIVVLLPLLGIVDVSHAFAGFSGSSVFFIIAVFAMPAVMLKTDWGARLLSKLLTWTGTDSRKLVLGFMIATAVVSTIMSDLPCTALFLGFALTILRASKAHIGTSNLGKCLMIGIPVASMTGGIATPAGSSFNVVAMNILQQTTGGTISFFDWMIVGVPITIIMVPVLWFFITTVIKPEAITNECLKDIRNTAAAAKNVRPYEMKALAVILLMVALWILGNWMPMFDVTIVAIVGLIVMFLPGMNLITWSEFQAAVPWGIVMLVGAILTVGGVVQSTGGAAFLANLIANSGATDFGFLPAMVILITLVYLLHTVCPIGPAILSIFIPIFATICASFGVSPVVPTISLAIVVAANVLLPVNPIVMLTYGEGYYSFGDMFKAGIVPAIVLISLIVLWVPFIVGILGI